MMMTMMTMMQDARCKMQDDNDEQMTIIGIDEIKSMMIWNSLMAEICHSSCEPCEIQSTK